MLLSTTYGSLVAEAVNQIGSKLQDRFDLRDYGRGRLTQSIANCGSIAVHIAHHHGCQVPLPSQLHRSITAIQSGAVDRFPRSPSGHYLVVRGGSSKNVHVSFEHARFGEFNYGPHTQTGFDILGRVPLAKLNAGEANEPVGCYRCGSDHLSVDHEALKKRIPFNRQRGGSFGVCKRCEMDKGTYEPQ